MSLSEDMHAIAARLEPVERIGERTLGAVVTASSNPAAVEGIEFLGHLVGANVDPAVIADALGGIRALIRTYVPAVLPVPQAA